jgi:hypothetical protein
MRRRLINKTTCSTDESIATDKSREIMLYSEFSKPYTFTCYLVFMDVLCECLNVSVLKEKKGESLTNSSCQNKSKYFPFSYLNGFLLFC